MTEDNENSLTESVRSNDSRSGNNLCSICRCSIESGQIYRTIDNCGHINFIKIVLIYGYQIITRVQCADMI